MTLTGISSKGSKGLVIAGHECKRGKVDDDVGNDAGPSFLPVWQALSDSAFLHSN